jgi:hypothetical protein
LNHHLGNMERVMDMNSNDKIILEQIIDQQHNERALTMPKGSQLVQLVKKNIQECIV